MHKRLGEILVQAGVIDDEQLKLPLAEPFWFKSGKGSSDAPRSVPPCRSTGTARRLPL